MATRTAYPPDSIRYRLRQIAALRRTVRLARRIAHLPDVIPRYFAALGLDAVRVFILTAVAHRDVEVRVPGLARPLALRPRTSDKYCFEQVFLRHFYRPVFLREPRLIVDAGANVGFASIQFANLYPRAFVIALEPEPANFDALVRNVRPYPNIKPIRAALWSRAEPLVIDNSDDAWACFVTRANTAAAGSTLITQAVTIPDLLKLCGATTIDILKMDVEGAEKEIFSAADCSWLAQTRVLMIELHDRMVPGCSEALDSAFAAYSFRRSSFQESTILINNQLAPEPLGPSFDPSLDGGVARKA